MGAKQAKLKSELLDELTHSTTFSEQDIHRWYRGFLKDCPSGQLTVDDFQRLYCALFGNSTGSVSSENNQSDPRSFARLVFRAFDRNGDGVVEFRDIMTTLNVTCTGHDEQKRLRWAFCVYDLDGDGFISKTEMLQVVKAIYQMIGTSAISKSMPLDEMTPERRTGRLFALMDKDGDDRISLEEFIEGVRADPEVFALLQTPVMQPPTPSATPSFPDCG